MRTIKTVVYQFDELSDTAKEKAREWYRSSLLYQEQAWESTLEDAANIGLEILSLDDHRQNEGKFTAGAEETAHKIEEEHGDTCDTFKTAKQYLEARDTVIRAWERDENGEFVNEHRLDVFLDALDSNFLHDLLEDYHIMLNKEIEYLCSNESVDESIRANEYEFTKEGERA